MNKTFETTKYKTADGKHICVEVTIEVKELLEETDRKIRSQGRQDRRYLDKREYIDGLTDSSIASPEEDIADLVCRMDSYAKLYVHIKKLPEVQRRRLILYYFHEMTYRQIADIEGVNHTSICSSVKRAINTIRKHFNK